MPLATDSGQVLAAVDVHDSASGQKHRRGHAAPEGPEALLDEDKAHPQLRRLKSKLFRRSLSHKAGMAPHSCLDLGFVASGLA